MYIIDKYTPVTYGSVTKDLQDDISLLESYTKSVAGAGLESLDYPAGKLIVAGLVNKYPDQLSVGCGLEGISDLIKTLKDGLKNIKKMGRAKAKPILDKVKYSVEDDIKKTYGSDSWYRGKDPIGKPVDVSELSKLVGDFTDVTSLISAVNNIVTLLEKAIDTQVNATMQYAKMAIGDWNKMVKKPEDDRPDEAVKLIGKLKPKLAALKSDLPDIKTGSVTTIDGVSIAEAKTIAATMINAIKKIYNKEDNILAVIDEWDDMDDDSYGADADDDDVSELFWNYCNWESVTLPADSVFNKALGHVFSVLKELEKLIINSVK